MDTITGTTLGQKLLVWGTTLTALTSTILVGPTQITPDVKDLWKTSTPMGQARMKNLLIENDKRNAERKKLAYEWGKGVNAIQQQIWAQQAQCTARFVNEAIVLVQNTYPEEFEESFKNAANQFMIDYKNMEDEHQRSTYSDISTSLFYFYAIGIISGVGLVGIIGGVGLKKFNETKKQLKKAKSVAKEVLTKTGRELYDVRTNLGMTNELQVLGQEYQETRNSLLETRGELDLTRRERDAQQHESETLRTELDATKASFDVVKKERDELLKTVTAEQSRLEQINKEIERLNRENFDLKKIDIDHRSTISQQGITIKERNATIDVLVKEKEALEQDIQKRQASIDVKNAEIDILNIQAQDQTQKLGEEKERSRVYLEELNKLNSILSGLRIKFAQHLSRHGKEKKEWEAEKEQLEANIFLVEELLKEKQEDLMTLNTLFGEFMEESAKNMNSLAREKAKELVQSNDIQHNDIDKIVRDFYAKAFETIDLVYQMMYFICNGRQRDMSQFSLFSKNEKSERFRLLRLDSFSVTIKEMDTETDIDFSVLDNISDATYEILESLETLLKWSKRFSEKSHVYILLLEQLCIAYYTKLHLRRDIIDKLDSLRVIQEWMNDGHVQNPTFDLIQNLIITMLEGDLQVENHEVVLVKNILQKIKNLNI